MSLKSYLLIAALIPNFAFAADLPQYQVGPFNFNKTPMSKVLTQVFEGTGIAVYSKGVPNFDVSTKGLSGPLDQVVEKLTTGANLTYKFDGATVIVTGKNTTPALEESTEDAPKKPLERATRPYEAPMPVVDAAAAYRAPEQQYFDLKVEDGDIGVSLARWAKAAQWNLIWEVPAKFPISTGTRFKGSFEESVTSVVDALKDSDTPIRAKFYDGNRVLRIIQNNGDK